MKELSPAIEKLKSSGEEFKRFLRLRAFALRPLNLSDFKIYRAVGRGAFGLVSAAAVKELGEMCAVKEQDRKAVKARKQGTKIVTEAWVRQEIS